MPLYCGILPLYTVHYMHNTVMLSEKKNVIVLFLVIVCLIVYGCMCVYPRWWARMLSESGVSRPER